jgi:hypothetical protein
VNILAFAWFNLYQEPYNQTGKKEFPEIPKGVKTIRLLSEHEPIMDVAVHIQDQSGSEGVCYTIGPFKNLEAAEGAVADMASNGRIGTIRIDNQEVKKGYWVYIESRPVQDLENIIQVLKENGIKDYHKNARNELSLGIYNGIQSAKRRQKSIAELGYSPAMGPLRSNQTLYWIDVAKLKHNILTDESWDRYMAKYPGSKRKSSGCDLINT